MKTRFAILVFAAAMLVAAHPAHADVPSPPAEALTNTGVLLVAGLLVVVIAIVSWLALRRLRAKRQREEAASAQHGEGSETVEGQEDQPERGGGSVFHENET